MATINLERAAPVDAELYYRLEQTVAGQKTYSTFTDVEKIKKKLTENIVYFIELSNEYVGAVEYEFPESNHAYISGLFVDPKYQKQGIAKQVMNLILEELKGVQKIDLVVHPENIAAVHLYQSLGFVHGERKENYFGDGEPRITMALVKR